MSRRLEVRLVQRATRQIREAAQWWEENRPAAPGAVETEVANAIDLLGLNPRVGARALNVKLEGVRRIHLSRVHYHLYYRILDKPRCVEVLALWHTSRGSGPVL